MCMLEKGARQGVILHVSLYLLLEYTEMRSVTHLCWGQRAAFRSRFYQRKETLPLRQSVSLVASLAAWHSPGWLTQKHQTIFPSRFPSHQRHSGIADVHRCTWFYFWTENWTRVTHWACTVDLSCHSGRQKDLRGKGRNFWRYLDIESFVSYLDIKFTVLENIEEIGIHSLVEVLSLGKYSDQQMCHS
jgi:hypothetical protein